MEAALTPSGAGASSPAGEMPREQLKGLIYKGFGLIYLPAASVRPQAACQGQPAGGEPGGIAGRVAECRRGSWPGGTESALKSRTSTWELQTGLNPSRGLCRNSGNVLFSGFKCVM